MSVLVTKNVDVCRARGCGGLLRGFDSGRIADGTIAHCGKCGRDHTFHVPDNDGPIYVQTAAWSRPRKSRRGS